MNGLVNAKPTLRLQLLLDREIKKVGNPNRLAHLVNDANARVGSKLRVNRRTLLRIRDNPESVGITVDLLSTLDIYFRQYGEGFNKLPMLASRGLMEPLFDADSVVCMLGAKPRPAERRVDWSRWDGLALAELIKEASRVDRRHEFDIEDVLWRVPKDPSALKSETWYSLLEKEGTSVISIGSPIASLSTEVMLARMFEVTPFEQPHFSPLPPLPFYFVWAPRVARKFRSAFGLSWRHLTPSFKDLGEAVRKNQSAGFFLGGKPHAVPLEGKNWTMYGIIAAQRRANRNVWLVISGLAGPATLAAARLVKQITAELPFSGNRHSDVLWIPVKASIRIGRPSSVVSGDLREIADAELVGEPNFWRKPVLPAPQPA